jgi:integrase
MARHIIKGAFSKAGIEDDGRLGTHTLRKTWARNVYKSSGNDILLLSAALNHQNVVTTQRYLSVDDDELMVAMQKCDFTRGPRKSRPVVISMPTIRQRSDSAA